MKLIRLSTEDDRAFFKSRFNTDVIIPADAQIALQNFSTEVDLPEIVIDAGQRKIEVIFTPDTSSSVTATLTSKEAPYSNSNWADFMTDLQSALNNNVRFKDNNYALVFDDATLLAIEFAVSVTEALKTRVEYKYSVYNTHANFLRTNLVVAEDPGTGEYHGPGQTNTYQQAILAQLPVSRGNGIWRCQLSVCNNDAAAPAGLKEQGFFIGFSRLNCANIEPNAFPTPSAPVNNEDDTIVFGAGLSFVGGTRVYYTQIGNADTQSAIVPDYLGDADLRNDFLEVQVLGNTITARRYKSTGAAPYREVLGTIEMSGYNKEHTLYPVLFFHSEVAITNLTWTPTPFAPSVNLGTEVYDVPGVFDNVMPVPRRQNINNMQLNFETKELGQFMGYKLAPSDPANPLPFESDLADQNTILAGAIEGENEFKPREEDPHVMLELVSHPIESYDSKPGVRKSLLSTMIRYDPNGMVRSEPPRTFIDLENPSEINFKNVEVRLVDNNYRPVAVKGRSIATLLIKRRDELA